MLPSGVFNTKYETDIAVARTKTQWLLLAMGIVFVLTMPLFLPNYWLTWTTKLCVLIIILLGLHILTGLCGQYSLGQSAIMGVGAYTTAILATRYGLHPLACLPLSMLSAGVVGVIFGLPCFRIKGFYLAMSTFAAQIILVWCFLHLEEWTGGAIGIYLGKLNLGGIDFGSRANLCWLAIGMVVIATILAKNIQRTKTGRTFIAIRDNDLAAEVSGISLFRYKMLAFFIACLYAGAAGWLFVYSQGRVSPEQFRFLDCILYLGMLTVGGLGSTTGVFFGTIFLQLLNALIVYLSPYVSKIASYDFAMQFQTATGGILFSLIVIAFLIFEPRGMYHLWEKIKSSYRLHPYSH